MSPNNFTSCDTFETNFKSAFRCTLSVSVYFTVDRVFSINAIVENLLPFVQLNYEKGNIFKIGRENIY